MAKLDIHVLKDLEVLIDVLVAHLGSSSHSLLLLVGGVSNRKQILSPSSSKHVFSPGGLWKIIMLL